jgi:hypothetical protein
VDVSFGATPRPEALLLADVTGVAAPSAGHGLLLLFVRTSACVDVCSRRVVQACEVAAAPDVAPVCSAGDGRDDLVALTPLTVAVSDLFEGWGLARRAGKCEGRCRARAGSAASWRCTGSRAAGPALPRDRRRWWCRSVRVPYTVWRTNVGFESAASPHVGRLRSCPPMACLPPPPRRPPTPIPPQVAPASGARTFSQLSTWLDLSNTGDYIDTSNTTRQAYMWVGSG